MRSVLLLCALATVAHADGRAEIVAFNKTFDDATRHMDTAALVALWSDDGVSLLPGMKAIVGKPAIEKFLGEVMGQLKGAKMKTFEDTCSDIEVAGTLATEWCVEHQIVDLPGGKPPFEGWGKMLLVLRRIDGKWKLAREMWNAGVRP